MKSSQKIVVCTIALSMMLAAGSAYAHNDNHKNHKKTGLENALERGNKNEKAREAIRKALEKRDGKKITLSEENRVQGDLKLLAITYAGKDNASSVTNILALPIAGLLGSDITWKSSHPTVISHDGLTVNRPAAGQNDVVVTLTATVTYGQASATKSFKLTVKAQTNEAQRVAADKAALNIGFSGTDTAGNVTKAVTLPTSGSNGSKITWTSSSPSIISHDGKTVNRPAFGQGDIQVTLTAKLVYGSVTDTKTFTLTVKPQMTDLQRITADKAALVIKFGGSDTASSVTGPLTLPTSGPNGSKVTWYSSNTAVISHDGKTVIRPAAGSSDASVVLTAVLTSGSLSEVQTYTITVKRNLTDAEKVAADAQALAVGFNGRDSSASVTQAIKLPSTAPNGSAVIWYSSNPAVISNDGKTVVRPAVGQGDITVTFTAFISSGGYSDTKVFTLTVKQQLTDEQRVAADKEALAVGYASGETSSAVTKNLTLPSTAPNGSSVIWVSSNTSIISANGTVVRPASGGADVSVVLTAVITSGGVADTKAFVVTVKKLP